MLMVHYLYYSVPIFQNFSRGVQIISKIFNVKSVLQIRNLLNNENKLINNLIILLSIIVFTFLSSLQGYRFGVGDLDTYVPFVFHESNHSLFSTDLLTDTIENHPVYIWKLFGLLSHIVPTETLFLFAFFFQILFLTFAFIIFYRHFFEKSHWYILLLAMLVIPKTGAAMGLYGLNPYGHFHPCALAIGVMLITFVMWDKGKWITGGILSGIIFLFHPFTAITNSLTFFFVILFKWRSLSLIKIACSSFMLLLFASPALLPYFEHLFSPHSSNQVFDVNSWFDIVRVRMDHSFFISHWVPDRFVHLLAAILALVIGFRKHTSFMKIMPLIAACVASLCIMAFAEIFSVKFLLQLQLGRNSYIILVVLIFFMTWRVSQINFSKIRISDAIWIFAALFFIVYSLVEKRNDFTTIYIIAVISFPIALFVISKLESKNILPNKFTFFCFVSTVLVLMSVATIVTTSARMKTNNRIFSTAFSTDFDKIAQWTRYNIPLDQTIMTPIYIEGFRSYSLHSIYGTYKDGAPHNYSEKTVFKWWERMSAFGMTLTTKRNTYPSLYHEHAIEIAKSENIKYVVYEKKYTKWNIHPLFENQTFGIVKIE